MPAKSKAQQRYFGMVHAGKIDKPKGMTDKEVKKMAKTKHKGLPAKKESVEPSTKQLIEGMTFKTFLIVEAMPEIDPNTTRGFIRSLPMYQELIKDPQTKPEALKIAKGIVDEFGDGPMDPGAKDFVMDQFDDLASKTYKGGMNVGDWEGEAAYQQKQADDEAQASAMDKWEQETGMDAETGAPVQRKKERMKRGATHQAAKFDKAKAEMRAFADAPSGEQADRLAAAKGNVDAQTAPARGGKMQASRAIFQEMFGEAKPSVIIKRMMEEVGMSKAHATTYYYKFKKQAKQQ